MRHLPSTTLTLITGALLFAGCIQAAPFDADAVDSPPDASAPADGAGGDVAVVDTGSPDATEPDATVPDATEPDGTEPDATEPDATEPDATEPDTTEPDATEPDATEPDATEPDATEPDATGPDSDAGCVPDCEGKQCGEDGCGGSCGECEGGESCGADQQCVAPVCEPGTTYCDGDIVKTCNAEGTGPDTQVLGVNCANEGEACIDGVCECVPACEGKNCGDDGCGANCGECGIAQTCDEDGSIGGESTIGTCVDWECGDGNLVCHPTNPSELVFCENGFYPDDDPEPQFDCGGPFGPWDGSLCILPAWGAKMVEAMDEFGPTPGCSCSPSTQFCSAGGNQECASDVSCVIAVECVDQKLVEIDCSDPNQAPNSGLCHDGHCAAEDPNGPSCGQTCSGDAICYATGDGWGPEACQNCADFCAQDWVSCGQDYDGNNGNGYCDCDCGPGPGENCLTDSECVGGYCATPNDFKCVNSGVDPTYFICNENNQWWSSDCPDGTICDSEKAQCVPSQPPILLCGWSNPADVFGPNEPDTCEGDPCSSPNGIICAVHPESGPQAKLKCQLKDGSLQWVASECGASTTCTAEYECGNHWNTLASCDASTAGSVKCLSWGEILRCEDNGAGYQWEEKDGCGANEVCLIDQCISLDPPDQPAACIVDDSAAMTLCDYAMSDPDGSSENTSVECCAGDTCMVAGSVCANTNDHTVLHCTGWGLEMTQEICDIGSTCQNGALGPNGELSASCSGSGSPDPCANCATEGTGALCDNNQCVTCNEVCSKPSTCGDVIGTDGKGKCECGDVCPEGTGCDFAANTCTDDVCVGLEQVCSVVEMCGMQQNACNEKFYCGPDCSFGICGDDYAAAVVAAQTTDDYYVVGRECHPVAGCGLYVRRFLGDGSPAGGTVLSKTDWFSGFDIVDPRAATLDTSEDKLLVVGSTGSSKNEDERYGFLAAFSVDGPAPSLSHIHKETAQGEIRDVAVHSSGGVLVAGYRVSTDGGGTAQREPWAMRYSFGANGVDAQWGEPTITLDSGSCHSELDDSLVSIHLPSGSVVLVAGNTHQADGEAIACVAQLNYQSGAPMAVHEIGGPDGNGLRLSRMKMRKKLETDPYRALLLGSSLEEVDPFLQTVVPRAFVGEVEFTIASNVATFQTEDLEGWESALPLEGVPGASGIMDACEFSDADLDLALVGFAQAYYVGDNKLDELPYLVTTNGAGVQAMIPIESLDIDLYETHRTDRIRSCAVVTTDSGPARLIMVGDSQEPASQAGHDDGLLVEAVASTEAGAEEGELQVHCPAPQ